MQLSFETVLKVLDAAHEELEECDLCLVVGTSSVVYPAAMFAPQVSKILTGGSKNGPLILRLQQGEFQWQNSTWRQLLPLRDLEDMVFSSKYKLQLYFHIFALRYFFRDPVEQLYLQHLPLES